MENPNSYTITTIKDIAVKIPADKLDAFFFDLRAAISQQKDVIEMVVSAHGEDARQMIVDALQENMVWTDDGKAEVTATISVDKTPIAIVTFDHSTSAQ